MLKISQVSIM